MNNLIDRIFVVTGVSFEEICSRSRKVDTVMARAIYAHEMRFKHGYSCVHISKIIGRTHPQICHLTNKYSIDVEILKEIRCE